MASNFQSSKCFEMSQHDWWDDDMISKSCKRVVGIVFCKTQSSSSFRTFGPGLFWRSFPKTHYILQHLLKLHLDLGPQFLQSCKLGRPRCLLAARGKKPFKNGEKCGCKIRNHQKGMIFFECSSIIRSWDLWLLKKIIYRYLWYIDIFYRYLKI